MDDTLRERYHHVLKLIEEAQKQAEGSSYRVRILLSMLVIELRRLLEQISDTGTGFS